MASKRSEAGLGLRTVVVGVVAISLLAPTMVASVPEIGSWTENQKFEPEDEARAEEFGAAVAVDGDLAVVGAPETETDDGDDAGAVHVYVRTLFGAWNKEATLTAANGDSGERFGVEVSLDGDTLLVGALNAENQDGTATGAAYVFVQSGPGVWTQQAKLLPSAGASSDNFGEALSLDGDQALVGASLEDNANGNAAGSAYVFARDTTGTWSQQDRVLAPDGDASDQFGDGASLDGDTALVGAPSDHDPGAEDTGSAYVVERTDGGWSVQTKLENPEPNAEDQYGAELSLDGDRALVASPYDDSHGTDAGSVYAYSPTDDGTWTLEDTLRDTDGGFLASFGGSVSLDGPRALIGSPRDSTDNGGYTGSAYLFTRDATGNWTQETKLTASDGASSDEFGAAGSLDGGTALVGAPAIFGDHSGVSYVYGNFLEQVNNRVQETGGTSATPAGTPTTSG